VGWLTRLFGKRELDDRLLKGQLSPDTGEGKQRAEELTSPHHRAKCAKALRDLVREADEGHSSFFNANLRVQRQVIRENRVLILTLAKEVEELPAVDPRGVILADRLVQDGESPVYFPEYLVEDHGEVARAVEQAREALKES
jgi:hypothetical protein